MRIFPFLKKSDHADSILREELVKKYFDDLQLDKDIRPVDDHIEFDRNKVYDRILSVINQPERRNTSIARRWYVAASLVAGIIVFLSALTYQHLDSLINYFDPIANKQLVAMNGQIVNYNLADGTKVWLNGGSKLTYPERFRGKLREVTLEGEAYLEVAHDAKKSFIIHTGAIKTQVLGTSFNVKAYPEDPFVRVDVVTGKVGVTYASNKSNRNETVFLIPSEQVVINKTSNTALKTQTKDVDVLTGWRDGGLVFKNMPLGEVLNAIQHRFNVSVKADVNLTNCGISANFTNVSLPNIMKIISKLIKGKAVADGSGYHLMGKGCK